MQLKEGNQIEIDVMGERQFGVKRVMMREEAVAEMGKLRRSLPVVEGFRFNREEL